MQFPSTTLQAMDVRAGDVLLRGTVQSVRSRPVQGVGGGVEFTFADGSTQHVPDRQTMIALDVAGRVNSLA